MFLIVLVAAGLVTFGLVMFLWWFFTVPNLPCPSDETVIGMLLLAILASNSSN